MIQENSDPIALAAQADIQRFYVRVIYPALSEFVPQPDPPGGLVDDMDVFLESARTTLDNAVCYEARRAFALIIGGMFERPLRLWLAHGAPDERRKIETAKVDDLEGMIERLRGVSFQTAGVRDDIRELWSVANAVRHGDGPSSKGLAQQNPSLWEHLPAGTLEDTPAGLVFHMRVKDGDLRRYTLAVMKFWSIAGASSIPGP